MVSNVEYQTFLEWIKRVNPLYWATQSHLLKNDGNLEQNPYFQLFLTSPMYQALQTKLQEQELMALELPNSGGMSMGEYWKRYQAALDGRIAKGEITEEEAETDSQQVWNNILAVANGELTTDYLPNWNTYRKSYLDDKEIEVRHRGTLLGNNYYALDGELWNLSGGAVKRETDPQVIAKYMGGGTTASQVDPLDAARFALQYNQYQDQKRRDALLDTQKAAQQRWENQLAQRRLELDEREMELAHQRQIADYKANPRNWIGAWFMEHPEAGQRIQSDYQIARERFEQAQRDLSVAGNRLAEMGIDMYGTPVDEFGRIGANQNPETSPYAAYDFARNEYDIAKSQYELAKADPSSRESTRYPKAPPTPQWLPTFAPTLKAGEELKKAPVTIASGQLWNRTPFTQREMLAGYLGYSKGTTADAAFNDYQQMVKANLPQWYRTSRFRSASQV